MGAPLSWLAAIPRQSPGDGRTDHRNGDDRAVAGRTADRQPGPQRTGPCQPPGAAVVGALARHRRTRPRPVHPRRLRRTHHARHGGRRRAAGGAHRPGRRQHRRLPGRLRRSHPDARHRRVPGISSPGAGTGLRRGAEARHHQRHHRDRTDRVAALCTPGASRHADGAPHRLHRRRATHRRIVRPHHPAPHHAAMPHQRDRARHARHERHHSHRGRPWLPRHGCAAADARVGHHDRRHRAPSSWSNGGCRRSLASPSSSRRWHSTCWATACATCWIQAAQR